VQEAEEPEQQDDRERNADQPKKYTLSHRDFSQPRRPCGARINGEVSRSFRSKNRSMLQTYFLLRPSAKSLSYAATLGRNGAPLSPRVSATRWPRKSALAQIMGAPR
jgi:hypothetical protein